MGMGLGTRLCSSCICTFEYEYRFLFSTNRLCVETTTIGDITIPKGFQITVPIYELHHDSKYWDEPEKFNPDRYNDYCTRINYHTLVFSTFYYMLFD